MTGTSSAMGQDNLDEARLVAWMQTNVDGFTGPVSVHKFAGGQSNPTYRLDSPSGAYVLRRKPFGPLLPSAHAVDREFAVIAGLHPTGFPVAKPYALCTDDSVLGSWFYVMSMIEGRTLWDGSLPGLDRSLRTTTYNAMIDMLAALHSVDYQAVGLGGYGKPGNYFDRQVGRWTKQYRASETEHMPEVESLIDYLARTVPEQTRTSIVHGDFRIDNLIYHSNEPRIIAVLDWELSTLGDPLADVAYFLMNWVIEPQGRSGILGLAGAGTGIPKLEEAAARYCAATDRQEIPDLNWYFAFNFFRLTGIVQGIKQRVIDGTASSAHAADVATRVSRYAKAAWEFAQKAGAQ